MAANVTGKRQTPENQQPSTQPNKIAKTNNGAFHSTPSNPINGHSYTPIPSVQATVNVNLPTLAPERASTLEDRVTQLESQVSLLQMMFDQSSTNGSQSLPTSDQEAKLTELAEVSASLLPAITNPKPFAAFTSRLPLTIPPTSPPRATTPPTQQVMTTASAPVSSSQTQTIPPPSQPQTMTPTAQPVMTTASAPVSSSQTQIVPPTAQPIVTTAIDPSPLRSPKTDFEKGCEFLAKEEYEKAIEHYLVALAAEPSKSSILYNLGRCYHLSKEFLKAIDCFSKIRKTSNLYISAQLKLGTCYLLQNEPKEAIEILTKIQGIKSVNLYDEFHTILGKCHSELEDPSKAIEHYKKVSQNYPFFAHTQNSLGLCYIAKNEPQTAIGFFREALIIAGSDQTLLGYAHYNLGTTYLAQKEDSKARMHFKLVPKDHEKFDEAQEHLKQKPVQ